MKRSGFTMIELIFVIVILGILAAVALPKFIGVSEQAQVGKLKGYVGTLNRTVGPALWADSVGSGNAGAVNTAAYNTTLLNQLETPDGIGDTAALDLTDPDLTLCSAPGANSLETVNVGDAAIGAGIVSGATVGGVVYSIGCENGDANNAPRFWLESATTVLVK